MSARIVDGFRLFRLGGIDVYVRYVWLLVAAFEIFQSRRDFGWIGYCVIEYITTFVIILMHEFGHARACLRVGGQVSHIVLEPIGGAAYITPPLRPAAHLWTIVAGPLVNLALLPITLLGLYLSENFGLGLANPDLARLVTHLFVINLILLIFNVLPVYPLDGGQILYALLWFVVGRSWALALASAIGLVGIAGLAALAVYDHSLWIGLLCYYLFAGALGGLQLSRAIGKLERVQRHGDAVCPSCHLSPPMGQFWLCDACGARFDTFVTGAMCPSCEKPFSKTTCPSCRTAAPFDDWFHQPNANMGET